MEVLQALSIPELQKLDLFKDIDSGELEKLVSLVQHQAFEKDEVIIEEEEIGDSFFILLDGRVRIEKKIDRLNSEVLGTYDHTGGIFGEMSLVEDIPRTAGIVADSKTRVLNVSKTIFLDLVDQFPRFTLIVARSISQFLRRTDQRLIENLRQENEDLKTLNKELQETQDELIGKERLSLIGRMASTILHDMKNPMSTIGGYAQIIKMKDHSREELHKYADIINKQVERFMRMTTDLLSFAQGGEQMKIVPVIINDFLEECRDAMSPRFEDRGVSLDLDLHFDGKVRMDTSRFYRVIENIAENALDVLQEGGSFWIRTEEVDTGIRITLEDDGPGMPEEVRANAFKEFFTQGKKKGTGLGLAIVRRVVDEHDGIIHLESEPDVGTKFMLDLPAVGYHLLPKSRYQIPIPFSSEKQQEDAPGPV